MLPAAMDISAATLAANSLQWANDGTGSERHHAQRLVSHMIAKPWSHKQKDRHAAVSPKSDQVLGYTSKVCDPILPYRLMLFGAFGRQASPCTILLVHFGGFNGSLWMIEVQPEGVSSPHQLRPLQNCAMIAMLNSRGKDLTG